MVTRQIEVRHSLFMQPNVEPLRQRVSYWRVHDITTMECRHAVVDGARAAYLLCYMHPQAAESLMWALR